MCVSSWVRNSLIFHIHTHLSPYSYVWFVFCSISITIFLFSSLLFYTSNRHVCHGAYWCTHEPAHMPRLLFHLHLHSSKSCVCVFKHVCTCPSSFIFINIYRYTRVCVLCDVLYIAIYSYLPSFSTNLIDTYETLTVDVLIPLLISLSSVFFCISIFVIHTYACTNLHIHFPSLTYPCTFIAILICMLVSTIL